MKVVTPIAGGLYLSEKLASGATMPDQEARSLMKQAADTIEKYRLQNQAVKIAMEMVERGKCEPFKSYDELQQKVASLAEKNLEAVKEALEMDSELTDFGKVASPQVTVPAGSSKAEMEFFHRLSE